MNHFWRIFCSQSFHWFAFRYIIRSSHWQVTKNITDFTKLNFFWKSFSMIGFLKVIESQFCNHFQLILVHNRRNRIRKVYLQTDIKDVFKAKLYYNWWTTNRSDLKFLPTLPNDNRKVEKLLWKIFFRIFSLNIELRKIRNTSNKIIYTEIACILLWCSITFTISRSLQINMYSTVFKNKK